MGGGNYSRDWTPNRGATYSFPKTNYASRKVKNDTSSLENLIQKYVSSNIHAGKYSFDSIDEINKFFKVVDNILIGFQKIDQKQSQLLQGEFEKIKLQYRRSRTGIINRFYNSLNLKNNPTHSIQPFSLNIDLDSPIRIKLSNFISWLDKTLQVYDLWPSDISKERTDER